MRINLSKTPAFLLLSGLSAAALVALISRPEQPATSNVRPDAGSKKRVPPHPLSSPPKAPARPRIEPLVDWTPESIPQMEDVRNARLPRLRPRQDIAKEGISALLRGFECNPPYTIVNEGMTGPGDVGCGVSSDGGGIIRLGKWVRRRPTGDLESARYEDGQLHGTWERYSAAGVLRERGQYEYGRRHGEWEEYSPEGKHLGHRVYRQGRYHGVTVLFHRMQPTVEVWQDGELVSRKTGFEEAARTQISEIVPEEQRGG